MRKKTAGCKKDKIPGQKKTESGKGKESMVWWLQKGSRLL